eukprot:GHVP01069933.1.p2 GENE.GHVP01069933.1~~GHVP01069933.1.p2  ORF type:complete len:524 (-),score=106.52 GHVP01069933.1:118-1689(-)
MRVEAKFEIKSNSMPNYEAEHPLPIEIEGLGDDPICNFTSAHPATKTTSHYFEPSEKISDVNWEIRKNNSEEREKKESVSATTSVISSESCSIIMNQEPEKNGLSCDSEEILPERKRELFSEMSATRNISFNDFFSTPSDDTPATSSLTPSSDKLFEESPAIIRRGGRRRGRPRTKHLNERRSRRSNQDNQNDQNDEVNESKSSGRPGRGTGKRGRPRLATSTRRSEAYDPHFTSRSHAAEDFDEEFHDGDFSIEKSRKRRKYVDVTPQDETVVSAQAVPPNDFPTQSADKGPRLSETIDGCIVESVALGVSYKEGSATQRKQWICSIFDLADNSFKKYGFPSDVFGDEDARRMAYHLWENRFLLRHIEHPRPPFDNSTVVSSSVVPQLYSALFECQLCQNALQEAPVGMKRFYESINRCLSAVLQNATKKAKINDEISKFVSYVLGSDPIQDHEPEIIPRYSHYASDTFPQVLETDNFPISKPEQIVAYGSNLKPENGSEESREITESPSISQIIGSLVPQD